MHENYPCPVKAFRNLISGKWALPILFKLILREEPVRFKELQRALAPITQKELTRYLRQFEEQGLVRRMAFPGMPLRVEYEISDLGRTLKPPLDSLARWMLGPGAAVEAAAVHPANPDLGQELVSVL
jgi:DNA-binding HxlR family transcriptional regulator